MTRNFQSKAIALGVLGLGLTAWTMAGRSLNRDGQFLTSANVLHLKGSPFGRTIAMAMQGPADVYFHQGQDHDHDHDHDHDADHEDGCSDCEKTEPVELEAALADSAEGGGASGNELLVAVGGSEHVHTDSCGHDCPSGDAALKATHNHGPGEECATCDDDHEEALVSRPGVDTPIRERILAQIREWRAADNTRTNPYGNTDAHKFFIRREIEKKLFLSYQMDPTNYAGYGAYFLFLNESSLGTRANGKKHARKLASVTAAHCMREQDNPQALLTAAVASHDMISLLIEEDSSEALGMATQYVSVTGHCLNRFEEIALQMVFDGTWEHFSGARQHEMSERVHLLRKLHEADRKILSASVNNAGNGGDNREGPTG